MFYFYAPTLWKPITHLHTPFSGGIDRSSPPEVFLGKRLLEICSKFAEQPRRSVISMRLFCNFIEIALWNRNFPVNLLHIFIAPFSKNTSDGLTQHNNGALGESGLKICLDNAIFEGWWGEDEIISLIPFSLIQSWSRKRLSNLFNPFVWFSL